MKIYHLRQEQFLPISLGEAWSFFSNPRNLEAITPSNLNFKIRNVTLDMSIYEGQIIHYKIRILPFVWVSWVTEISKVKEREYFIDDQRLGPYAFWHHQHHFREVNGGVEMRDVVTYAIPFGWIGNLIHRVYVNARLRQIFDYRRNILDKKFEGEKTPNAILL